MLRALLIRLESSVGRNILRDENITSERTVHEIVVRVDEEKIQQLVHELIFLPVMNGLLNHSKDLGVTGYAATLRLFFPADTLEDHLGEVREAIVSVLARYPVHV